MIIPLLLLLLQPATTLTADRLKGLSEPVAEVALGQPDVARKEAFGAMWTYRKVDCVLFVFLTDKGQGMKVSGVSAGPRRAGDATPSTDACLASEALPKPAPSAQPVPAPQSAPETPPAPPTGTNP